MSFLNLRQLVWITATAVALESACTGPLDDLNAENREGPNGSANSALAALSDAQIAAVLKAANTGEITLGQLAAASATDPAVADFARKMVLDHTQANQAQSTALTPLGIVPVNSKVSELLTSFSASQSSFLESLSGLDFDQAYMDFQVQTHGTVLNLLDTQLIPEARNPSLQTLLTDVRSTVAAHLALAVSVRQALTP